jgi:hypothetical protein
MGVGLRFGAGPLRVYVPLSGGRKKRRKPKKKLVLPKTRGQWIAFLIILGVILGFVLTHLHTVPPAAATSSKTKTVTRAGFAGTWPLTVDSVVLACPAPDVVTLQAGGTVYALSSEAELAGKYVNLQPLMAGPVTQGGIGGGIVALAAEGEKLC